MKMVLWDWMRVNNCPAMLTGGGLRLVTRRVDELIEAVRTTAAEFQDTLRRTEMLLCS
jgi:hypothetical protein